MWQGRCVGSQLRGESTQLGGHPDDATAREGARDGGKITRVARRAGGVEVGHSTMAWGWAGGRIARVARRAGGVEVGHTTVAWG
jgi:hypothetical protein